jgi:seryl-tRNA synthetase
MIPINIIRNNSEEVIKKLNKKNIKNAESKVQKLLEIDSTYRLNLTLLENKRSEINKINKQIGIEIGKGNIEIVTILKNKNLDLKEDLNNLEEKNKQLESEQFELLVMLPNLPHDSVPNGKTSEDNIIVYSSSMNITLPENAKPHWEILEQKGIIDFELGVKITGAGFPVYKDKGAKLQRALINFFLDEAEKAGYAEIQSPILINSDSAFATGQLPDKEGQMYHATVDNLFLIPTAEVPITNIYRDVILDEKDLPIKNCGYTPCFRREAGSYGKDVRGLNRLHQFDKVEIVQIVKPENSYNALEGMVEYVKGLLEKLELPYRILSLCGGDMSFTSAKTYDFEVWSAAQKRWLEVSSVSNFESFQSNRLKVRYKKDKKTELLHTLNGSALALPRIVASILENNQQEDGSVLIPKALISYTKFNSI